MTMAIKPIDRYPGNAAPADADYPYGAARNESTPGESGDGYPLEEAWVNDWLGFVAAALDRQGVTPSGTPETALDSQILTALKGPAQEAGAEVLARLDAETTLQDTDWITELVSRILYTGTYTIAAEHLTPNTTGDGEHQLRVIVNGVQVGVTETAPADGAWYSRTFEVDAKEGDVVEVQSRMSTGAPPRQGSTRNRRAQGALLSRHVIASAGERTVTEAVLYV
jgi:hypothetical protein